jgi:ribosomal protein S18 acetylase RimI-like enzyme
MDEVEFSYELSGPFHVVRARIQSRTVGELSWLTDKVSARNRRPRGEVQYIETNPGFRRKGIATAMWRYAREHCEEKPRHSRTRSADGRAWVASLR